MNNEQKENAKKLIVEWVGSLGRISTSRIAGIIGKNIVDAKKLLDELYSENKLNKEEETTATYWSLWKTLK